MTKQPLLWVSAIFLLVHATSCASRQEPDSSRPVPVVVVYNAKLGKEKELEDVLSRQWNSYLRQKMVLPKPHFLYRERESDGKVHFTELFAWVGYFADEHPPEMVLKLDRFAQELCETRNGMPPVQFRDADFIVPQIPSPVP